MSSVHTSIDQQRFGGAAELDRSAGGEEWLVRRLRRGLLAIAVVAVGFLVFQGVTAPDYVSSEGFEVPQAPAAEQAFDGRGKWTGYTR